MANKPTVLTKCAADCYAMENERIIELSDGRGAGCLVSVVKTETGLAVTIYRVEKCEIKTEKLATEGDAIQQAQGNADRTREPWGVFLDTNGWYRAERWEGCKNVRDVRRYDPRGTT